MLFLLFRFLHVASVIWFLSGILGLVIGAPILGFLEGADRNWLLVSNIILLGFLNGPFIFLPRGKLFRVALENALAKRQITPEMRAHLDDPIVRLAHGYEWASMVVIVYLMMFKPF